MISLPFAALGFIWAFAELVLTVKRRVRPAGESKDRGSLQWIWLVWLVSFGVGIAVAETAPALRFSHRGLVYGASAMLFGLGIFVRGYAIHYLGRYFTTNVSIAKDHRLIDAGPYRVIRHPSYAGALLICLGLALSTANLASLLVIFVPVFAVMSWRIHIEEAALIGALGDEYRSYMKRTRRLIPLVY